MDTQEQEQTTLPADPDRCNSERAERGTVALEAYRNATGSEYEDQLADLLCDLMHWADRDDGESFEAALDRASMHYEAETTE